MSFTVKTDSICIFNANITSPLFLAYNKCFMLKFTAKSGDVKYNLTCSHANLMRFLLNQKHTVLSFSGPLNINPSTKAKCIVVYKNVAIDQLIVGDTWLVGTTQDSVNDIFWLLKYLYENYDLETVKSNIEPSKILEKMQTMLSNADTSKKLNIDELKKRRQLKTLALDEDELSAVVVEEAESSANSLIDTDLKSVLSSLLHHQNPVAPEKETKEKNDILTQLKTLNAATTTTNSNLSPDDAERIKFLFDDLKKKGYFETEMTDNFNAFDTQF